MINEYSKPIYSKENKKNNCPFCNRNYNAYYKTIFYEMPEILIIHPLAINKSSINFEEGLSIKMSEHLDNKKIKYHLIGLISHFEKDNRSHNIAHCKIESIWYEFNDSYIFPANIRGGGRILLFIYQKEKDENRFY